MTEHRPEANANESCVPPAGKEMIERSKTTVLIADRLPAMREHVVKVLNNSGHSSFKTLQAGDSQQALEILGTHKPQLAVIDTSLPGQNGLFVGKALWKENPQAKILFAFSSYSEVHLRELERIIPPNGVYGIVLKTIKENELTYAIDCLMVHDNTYIDPQIRAVRSRVAGQDCLLTDLELETLQDVALGLTDKAISLRRNISVRGVQSRVASLFAKLIRDEDEKTRSILAVEVINPRARLIFHAIRRGLLDLEQLDSWESSFAQWLQESKTKGNRTKDFSTLPLTSELRQARPNSFSA